MRLDQKKVTVQMRPPPLSALLYPPLHIPSSPFSFVYPPPSTQQSRGDSLSPTTSPSCSLSLALARNKFAMKMGKNYHHGPARETQGESDIIPHTQDPPSSSSQPSRLAPVGTPVPQIICILSFLQAVRDVAYCLASR